MPRNSKFNAKLRVLTRILFRNQDFYADYRQFVNYLKLEAGFVEVVVSMKGDVSYVPRSLRYDLCPEEDARELYSKLIDIGIRDFCPGSTQQEIDAKVEEILSFV